LNLFHIADCGDHVVVINAKEVMVTGRKAEQKVYRHHTGYPGGLKEIVYKDLLEKNPEEVYFFLHFSLKKNFFSLNIN